jgi:fatty acid desaturase
MTKRQKIHATVLTLNAIAAGIASQLELMCAMTKEEAARAHVIDMVMIPAVNLSALAVWLAWLFSTDQTPPKMRAYLWAFLPIFLAILRLLLTTCVTREIPLVGSVCETLVPVTRVRYGAAAGAGA